jgi:hypothetical protein
MSFSIVVYQPSLAEAEHGKWQNGKMSASNIYGSFLLFGVLFFC